MARIFDDPQKTEDFLQRCYNIARKYSRRCSVSVEDMFQEVCVKMVVNQYQDGEEDIKQAMKAAERVCLDVIRDSVRRDSGITPVDFDDPATTSSFSKKENFDYGEFKDRKPMPYDPTFNRHRGNDDPSEDTDEYDVVFKLLETLGERERKYVVVKGYLSGNIRAYEKEFNKLFNELSEEDKEKFVTSKRRDSDDVITKLFLGIKTGTNSGTIRAIKTNIRRCFRESGLLLSFC